MTKAMELYIGKRYIQHSTGVKTGKNGFIEFFTDFVKRNPKRNIQIIRAIEDSNKVFLQVYQNLNDKGAQWVTTDMFDFDENEKIIEHWDVISEYISKENTTSQNDVIFGDFEIEDLDKTQENKILVRNFLTNVFQNMYIDSIASFVSNNLIQHSRNIDNGLDSYKEYIKSNDIKYDFVFQILGQGNYVVSYSKIIISNTSYAIFDIFRIENNLIVEHWDNYEKIPVYEELTNSGKF